MSAIVSRSATLARPFHFTRTHIPTGKTTVGDFNGTHEPCWSDDNWRYTPIASLARSAVSLVERWNGQRPENTLWRYALANGPAPAAS
ncbi:hypothetical protein [Methylibium petroleiphilum]|uniref:Uncharacterized protein n=1 Tax=Methylibium petroleiphilum (strain ATCC BAA-1232 / LMG 22953 / PM1) TaxID=420662 RepID=A2SMU0_METPP|nr:hypothetical protein [Methylibium petroleiphilum]ABM96879.1 hypothetical protein Mpe_B0100 [Methylibium petroleiphilum PM1]